MQLIQNKRGFTLVELAVTLGITGLLTVVFMRFSMTTYNQEALLKYKASVNETLTLVQSALKDPNKCTEMLKGATITPNGTELPDGLLLNGGTVSLLKTGKYGDFEVSNIMLAESVFHASSFDVVISFNPRGMTAVNSFFSASNSNITERITVVGLKETGKVKTCGPILSDTRRLAKQRFCENMPKLAKMVGDECVFVPTNIKCTPPEVPYQLRREGIFFCRHIANQVDFDLIFDFNMNECTTKNYSFFLTPQGKITVGCPTAAQKAAGANVLLK
jgi:prepilin-type N-terminal cleavage/methylation domain-containing protein